MVRNKSVIEFKEYIDQLYNDFLQGPTHSNKDDVLTWTFERIESFPIDCVAKVLDICEADFDDKNQSLFDLGLDSITAIQLRNTIAHHFDNVPHNSIFQNQSISNM